MGACERSSVRCGASALATPFSADAIGVHLTDLPLTQESIFRAIQKKNGTPLPEDGND